MSIPIANMGLFSLLARLWSHLQRRRQRQLAVLLVLMVVSAFAEVVSLGAVLPFLGILTKPGWVFEHPFAASVAHHFNIQSPDQMLLPLTAGFALTALVAGAIRMLVLWVSTRVAFACGSDLSIEVYRRTLYQPYPVHIARNSSEVISGVTQKVGSAANVIYNMLILSSSVVLLVAITLALLAINPFIAMIAGVGFGASYYAITVVARRRLRRNSVAIAREQTHVVKALQEGLGGIRDVLLDGTQLVYCDVYQRADRMYRLAEGDNNFIGGCPRFVMEALGLVLIAALAYLLSGRPGGLSAALPALGALAVGAQRLLPALQQGYSAWASIAGNQASMGEAIRLLEQPLPADILQPDPAPLHLQQEIRFADVSFRYASELPWVLKGFNLTIARGSRVGIVGTTGSGKSTALDLLMGLLVPTSGEILIDGELLAGGRVRGWQRNIAHVPQTIFLSDTTFAENIAFGVPRAQIDMERVRRAARQAQIADFIESSPLAYENPVGERGVRLSGGQRQRIGIARALYRQAHVLVFDEATSALDNATEQSVIDSIDALNRELTIVVIAHRLTTVRHCDTIVELAHGNVLAQGSYSQLLQSSASFRSIAQAGGRGS